MNTQLFIKGLSDAGLSASPAQIEKFEKYSRILVEWNEKMNLTAIKDNDGIALKHFLDSVLPLSRIEVPKNSSVVDVGTGAGFPGIPLKIIRPDLKLTLIDSLQKRINFLKEVSASLNLGDDVSLYHARAEELGKKPGMRESFDIAVSRAVAHLRILSEYCLPYVKTGGTFVALKAEQIEDELEEARSMIGTLGGKVEGVIKTPLPQTDMIRSLVIIKKNAQTPPSFPRRANKIK